MIKKKHICSLVFITLFIFSDFTILTNIDLLSHREGDIEEITPELSSDGLTYLNEWSVSSYGSFSAEPKGLTYDGGYTIGRLFVTDRKNGYLISYTQTGVHENHFYIGQNCFDVADCQYYILQDPTYIYTTGAGVTGYKRDGTVDSSSNTYSYSNVAVDNAHNKLLVTDRFNHKVHYINAQSGVVQSSFGGYGTTNGKFNNPTGIDYNPDTDEIYVIDAYHMKVQVLTLNDGNIQYVRTFGGSGSGPGKFGGNGVTFSCADVVVDKNNDDIVYITDPGNNRIQVFDRWGNYITHFGSYGSGTGQFNEPSGIAFDSANNRIAVADTKNSRIQVFSSYTPPAESLVLDDTLLIDSTTCSITASFTKSSSIPKVELYLDNVLMATYNTAGLKTIEPPPSMIDSGTHQITIKGYGIGSSLPDIVDSVNFEYPIVLEWVDPIVGDEIFLEPDGDFSFTFFANPVIDTVKLFIEGVYVGEYSDAYERTVTLPNSVRNYGTITAELFGYEDDNEDYISSSTIDFDFIQPPVSNPDISHPNDLEFFSGTTGHVISWVITDDTVYNPYFRIYVNNEEVIWDIPYLNPRSWTSGQSVDFCVDGANTGYYDIEIVAYDGTGGSISDTVLLHVIESPVPQIFVGFQGYTEWDEPVFYDEESEKIIGAYNIKNDDTKSKNPISMQLAFYNPSDYHIKFTVNDPVETLSHVDHFMIEHWRLSNWDNYYIQEYPRSLNFDPDPSSNTIFVPSGELVTIEVGVFELDSTAWLDGSNWVDDLVSIIMDGLGGIMGEMVNDGDLQGFEIYKAFNSISSNMIDHPGEETPFLTVIPFDFNYEITFDSLKISPSDEIEFNWQTSVLSIPTIDFALNFYPTAVQWSNSRLAYDISKGADWTSLIGDTAGMANPAIGWACWFLSAVLRVCQYGTIAQANYYDPPVENWDSLYIADYQDFNLNLTDENVLYDSVQDFANAASNYLGNLETVQETMNRLTSAIENEDNSSTIMQAEHLADYQMKIKEDLDELKTNLLISVEEIDNIVSDNYELEDIINAQNEIEQNGLDEEYIELLNSVGLTEEEILLIESDLIEEEFQDIEEFEEQIINTTESFDNLIEIQHEIAVNAAQNAINYEILMDNSTQVLTATFQEIYEMNSLKQEIIDAEYAKQYLIEYDLCNNLIALSSNVIEYTHNVSYNEYQDFALSHKKYAKDHFGFDTYFSDFSNDYYDSEDVELNLYISNEQDFPDEFRINIIDQDSSLSMSGDSNVFLSPGETSCTTLNLDFGTGCVFGQNEVIFEIISDTTGEIKYLEFDFTIYDDDQTAPEIIVEPFNYDNLIWEILIVDNDGIEDSVATGSYVVIDGDGRSILSQSIDSEGEIHQLILPFKTGTYELIVTSSNNDCDIPNDEEIVIFTDSIEITLWHVYEIVDSKFDDLEGYIDDNLFFILGWIVGDTIEVAENLVQEAYDMIASGSICCGLLHDSLSQAVLEIAEFEVEFYNNLHLISDIDKDYIISSIEDLEIDITLLMGLSVETEHGYLISLAECELIKLDNYIDLDSDIQLFNLKSIINTATFKLETAIFMIALDLNTESTICQVQNLIQKAEIENTALFNQGTIDIDEFNMISEYLIDAFEFTIEAVNTI